MKKRIISSLVAATLALASAESYAILYADINGGYGFPATTESNGSFTNNNTGNAGYEANVGVYFLPILAAEVGYNGFSQVEYSNSTTTSTVTLNGWHAALKLQIDLPLNLFVQAKGGLGSLYQEGFQGNEAKTNYNGYWSLGGGWNMNDYLYLQANYTQMQGSNGIPTMGLISVGIGINLFTAQQLSSN